MRTSTETILHHSSDTIHNPGEFSKPQGLDSDLLESVCAARSICAITILFLILNTLPLSLLFTGLIPYPPSNLERPGRIY